MSKHLTVPQVLSWKPEAFGTQANEWDRQATELRTRMDTQWRSVDSTHESWQGPSGTALRTRFDAVQTKARQVLAALENARDAAKVADLNFTTAKVVLKNAVDDAVRKGFEVQPDGTCIISEKTKQSVYASVASNDRSGEQYSAAIAALSLSCDACTAAVKKALELAADMDNTAKTAIKSAFADLPDPNSFGNAGTVTSGPLTPPPENGSPAENRAWWDSLSDSEQQSLIKTQPASVGSLDGLPDGVRDQANRNLIPLERTRLEQELSTYEALVKGNPTDTTARNKRDDLRERLADLNEVDKQVSGDPDLKLLVLDMKSGLQGRAAIAVGDPDSADNISITTPGLGTNVRESLGGMVSEAKTLKSEVESQLGIAGRSGETVATIAWIGYDPPQKSYLDGDIVGVGLEARADSAAPNLAKFYEGLDTASTKNDPHITALGHSYGSLTTSLALQQNGRAVDDVVFYGSPGLGGHSPLLMPSPLIVDTPLGGLNDAVDSPDDLGLRPGHVYEMTEKNDPVAQFNRFGRSPAHLPWVTHLSTDELTVSDGHGNDRTYTGAEGHSEYPRTGSNGILHRSGYNLAAVVAGLPQNAMR
ncbi:alpha/beta hydrolase [Nocardia sp. JMUB6875]|uniref:alpha/beta hydrolase n=1 Tax=Nocardia sp. JMUB6875 TaxID=3158170 RepID=UPI0032E7BC9B